MTFRSILFQGEETNNEKQKQEAPAYFKDLNLDQIIDAITAGTEKYNLKPIFFTPLRSEEAVQYRQEIMRDLENKILFAKMKTFAGGIYEVTAGIQNISQKLAQSEGYSCNYLEKGRLLNSASVYCEKVVCLVSDIASFDLQSRGLSEFRDYIFTYTKSDAFGVLQSETAAMKADLATVHYCMLIKGGCIKVRKFENETNHTPEIERIFQKFRQGAVKDYRQKVSAEPYAEHVEAGVLNLVAKLYPDIFSRLDEYFLRYMNFINETIFHFAREIHFYLAYLEYMEKFKRTGLSFCYPQMSRKNKEIRNSGGFDLALAGKLVGHNQPVVCNDFYLQGEERIIVVSGPNQGGKTTFARTFGQLHYLASLGCPVAGSEAKLFLFDRIFTHFERAEDIQNLSGKLQNDLIRMNEILDQATTDSIIIMNEILSSTALKDAVAIGKKIMAELARLDVLSICVTFLDELASYSQKNVSMVSTVTPEDPARRTYKIIRSPADGLAYAIHIAKKYRLTYDCLKERIKV
jgi:Mismatch repair ATPase (MutS family)